jgi:Right handed beta helix region
MTRLKQAMGACLLASALLTTVETHAATYYVATTGNDSNPGTSSSPWRTIRYAVSKMVAGDTTYVRGGKYTESGIRFKRSGTQSAPIKLLNATEVVNTVLFANGSGAQYALGWINLEGFEIRNCFHGIRLYNLHDSVIRRNWIHHSGKGIQGNGTRILFDRNRISQNGVKATFDQGMYLNGTGLTITNNLIYGNLSYGITLNGSATSQYDPAKHPGREFALSENWIIANNTFAYSVNRGGIVVWGSTCNNARIENNIFYENGLNMHSTDSQGIDFTSVSCRGIQIRNNFAFATGPGALRFLGPGAIAGIHYTQSGNIVNTVNPGFVNAPATLPSAPNFALASGSSAINKGLTTSATKTSYTNVSRPQASLYDVGAFEFLSSSASLAAPTSLQLAN